MNKFREHVYVIPEDDEDRQIADGFVNHHRVKIRLIQVMPIANGWSNVLKTFKDEYVQLLRNYPKGYVVMLIDFDGQYDQRWKLFEDGISDDLKPRVFVIGSRDEPETLYKALKKKPEEIGEALANDCDTGRTGVWVHEQLVHNEPERKRLEETVRPFLFEQ